MRNDINVALEVHCRSVATGRSDRGRQGSRALAVTVLVLGTLGGCLEELDPDDPDATDESAQEVVYGIDHRQDVFAHSDLSLRRLAQQSSVALISPIAINALDPNNITFVAPPLGFVRNLCPGQRFAGDPTASSCSGTLIDDDLVLTAGHCIDALTCPFFQIVFNYSHVSPSTLRLVTNADVFTCRSVVAHEFSNLNGQKHDYAIIRLDRPAAPRFTPAPVRHTRNAMAASQPLGMIGTPSGIPFKIESGGRVRNPRAATLDFFTANTDSFISNSGSGIYDLASYTLAGNLTRGQTDYVASGSCNVVNTCAETGCGGEEVNYIGSALDELCLNAPTSRLCTPRNSFSYSATSTASATVNTTRQFVALSPGQTITVGTCGISGASGVGDTVLRLIGPNNTAVAVNDDAANCGALSKLTFTVPPLLGGLHEIQAGCFAAQGCRGTVAYTVTGPLGGSYSFTATATSSATVNTVNLNVPISAGQTITLGTCGVAGSNGGGNTFLRLFDPANREVALNDDRAGCGLLSRLAFTAAQGGVFQIRAGCFSTASCSGTVAYTLTGGGAMAYSATNTSSATTSTTNFNISLGAGQTIRAGTCGVTGSSGTGDTFLRLLDSANREVALNDDGGGTCGTLSNLTFTAPASGTFQLRGGCFSSNTCNGTVAYTLSSNDGGGTYSYIGLNTASANQFTVDQPVVLEVGQTLRLGTCGLTGSAGSGDTFLRLFGPDSQEVASSDDACGGELSNVSFTVPAGRAGAYTIRGGCFSSTTCTGTVAFTVE
jgi:V8-like Glu-specific endopeptidase